MTDSSDAERRHLPYRPHSLFLRRQISVHTTLGLCLVYASAYFLPATAAGAYSMPSGDVFGLIVIPTAFSVLVLAALISVLSFASRKWLNPRFALLGAVVATTIFSLIAIKGLLSAAGVDWEDKLTFGADLLTAQRRFKILAFFVVLTFVFIFRKSVGKLSRFLTGLGFAFAALAAFRVLSLEWGHSPSATAPTVLPPVVRAEPAASGAERKRPKRVVWVLFDETEFGAIYNEQDKDTGIFPNFERLARMSVFATDASSPASATLYSVPALLTGLPISGEGIKFDKYGLLSLQTPMHGSVPFDNAHSIFGAVGKSGRSMSILGFLHPYCKLFTVQRCDSFHWPEFGRLDSAIWANIPSTFYVPLGRTDSWEIITQQSLKLLPQYVARNDALTFLHLNIPHLPAKYAEETLHLIPSANPLIQYRHNLQLTDAVLGKIMHQLELSGDRDVMLIASTDHWLRNMWYQDKIPDVRKPILFSAWKVGETQGAVMRQPVSTVHTSEMIIDYLNDKIETQADIARWWMDKPMYPSFVVPNSY